MPFQAIAEVEFQTCKIPYECIWVGRDALSIKNRTMQPFIVFQIISRDAFHKTLPKILYGDGTILRDKYLLVWNIYWWYLFLRDHNSSMLSQIFINHFILQIFPIMCAHVTTSVSKRFKENGFTRNFAYIDLIKELYWDIFIL